MIQFRPQIVSLDVVNDDNTMGPPMIQFGPQIVSLDLVNKHNTMGPPMIQLAPQIVSLGSPNDAIAAPTPRITPLAIQGWHDGNNLAQIVSLGTPQ